MPFQTCNRKHTCHVFERCLLILTSLQIKAFVEGLFTLNNSPDRFKLNLRDFLIQLKEFSGDNTELYAEEKEQQDRDTKAAERERLSKVGGLLKPAELAEDDDELWLNEELRTEHGARQGQVEPSAMQNRSTYTGKVMDGWDMYDL